MAKPDNVFWRSLVAYIKDGKVVPVIGPELVTVRQGEHEQPLLRWLAQRLADDVGLDPAELPDGFELNDVVSAYLRADRTRSRNDLYVQIMLLLQEAKLAPSPALEALAAIKGLHLFVSLTADSLLAQAIAAARPGTPPRQIAYQKGIVNDLDVDPGAQRPVVYQLFGTLSSTPDYVICDEDLLEFMHCLQDKQRQPVRLFDELRQKHLLFLGCHYGDWMLRFLLRLTRGMEFSLPRKLSVVLADARIGQDAALSAFLASFSADTKVMDMPPAEFVQQLAQRWHEANPPQPDTAPAAPAVAAPAAGGGPGTGAVFVSYASENVEAARRLAEGLQAARLDVWFDKQQLEAGVDWANSIQRGIDRCALFLPVISRESLSEANRRRFFWGEWNEADQLARRMAPDEPFIVPVIVDDSRLDGSPLPDSFRGKQGVKLPGGQLSPEVAERLNALVKDFHRRRQAR